MGKNNRRTVPMIDEKGNRYEQKTIGDVLDS